MAPVVLTPNPAATPMVDIRALVEVVADYARTISGPYDVGDVLYRLSDQVVEVLPVDGAGVSIADADGRLQFVSATDDDVVRIEEQQVSSGQGPCQDAFRSGDVVAVADLATAGRWPAYEPVALARGCLAVAGIPMHAGDRLIGALNLYRRRAGGWEDEDLRIARVLADMASGYIVNALDLQERALLASRLERALESRVLIEQAKGVLMERHDLCARSAFELLRGTARAQRRRIHDLAHEVVEAGGDVAPD